MGAVMNGLFCARPMPLTTHNPPRTREQLREGDMLRCGCGKTTCRDYDITGKKQ